MDWLLDKVHSSSKFGPRVPNAPAKAAWLSSLFYRKAESKDHLKDMYFNCFFFLTDEVIF